MCDLHSCFIGTLIFKMIQHIFLWFFQTPTQTWLDSKHWKYSSEHDHWVKLCDTGPEMGRSGVLYVFKEQYPGLQKAKIPSVSFAAN